ncbi:unnamed protein product [Ilex paraguariensis]|uniref:Uncharacterized protein n=1 Tax=Ilex paraguariensis TaxID=185542 RepID=A0ABC8SFM4_9AQUA
MMIRTKLRQRNAKNIIPIIQPKRIAQSSIQPHFNPGVKTPHPSKQSSLGVHVGKITIVTHSLKLITRNPFRKKTSFFSWAPRIALKSPIVIQEPVIEVFKE